MASRWRFAHEQKRGRFACRECRRLLVRGFERLQEPLGKIAP
jgi:hypothetical protein